jgi:hypothetical protein
MQLWSCGQYCILYYILGRWGLIFIAEDDLDYQRWTSAELLQCHR